MEIEEKILKVFEAFAVDHVWTDENEVYFNERANCRKVTRTESINPKTKIQKNGK